MAHVCLYSLDTILWYAATPCSTILWHAPDIRLMGERMNTLVCFVVIVKLQSRSFPDSFNSIPSKTQKIYLQNFFIIIYKFMVSTFPILMSLEKDKCVEMKIMRESNEQIFKAKINTKSSWRESESDSKLISPSKLPNIWILMCTWNRSFCELIHSKHAPETFRSKNRDS